MDTKLKFIRKGTTLYKIISNSTWLLSDTGLRYAIGLFIGVWVVKYLGPERYGLYSYVLAFLSIFGAFAGLGLKPVVVAALVNKKDPESVILGSAFGLLLLSGSIVWIISILTVWLINPNDSLIIMMVILIGAGQLFQGSKVVSYYFEARLESKYTVLATNASFLFSNCLKIGVIVFSFGLLSLAAILLFESILAFILLFYAYKVQKNKISTLKWKYNISGQLLKSSAPLILSGFFTTIFLNIDQLMLKEMVDSKELGYYAASVKLTALWYIIPTIIQASIMPNIIETYKKNKEQALIKIGKVGSFLGWFSLLIAIVTTLFFEHIVYLIYGSEFSHSGPMLAISIWALIFVSFGVIRFTYIVASGNLKMSLYFGIIGAITNIILNLILIPIYGGNGAAIATLLSYSCSGFFANFIFPSYRNIGVVLGRSIFMPSFNLK